MVGLRTSAPADKPSEAHAAQVTGVRGMSAMTGTAKALKYTAFTLMALFGLLGGLFVAGYAFEDPGGWDAVLMTAGWVLPMLALVVYALVRKEAAGPVFIAVTAFVGASTLLDSLLEIVPRDDVGPVLAISVFSLGVALAFLGLYRSTLAGLLLVVLALVQLAAMVLLHLVHGGLAEGPGLGAMLGGSSGVVVVPLLVIGILFLLAGGLAHEHLRIGHGPTASPAH